MNRDKNVGLVVSYINILLREIQKSVSSEDDILSNLKYRGAVEGIATTAFKLGLLSQEEKDLWVGLSEEIPMSTDRSLVTAGMKNTAFKIIEESQSTFLLESTNPTTTPLGMAAAASRVGAQIDMAMALGLIERKDVDTWINEVRSVSAMAASHRASLEKQAVN